MYGVQRDSKNVKRIIYGTSQMMSPNDFLSQVCKLSLHSYVCMVPLVATQSNNMYFATCCPFQGRVDSNGGMMGDDAMS